MTKLKTSEEQEAQGAEDLEEFLEGDHDQDEGDVPDEETGAVDDKDDADEDEAQSSLVETRESLRDLLDYDQLQEVRLALKARRSDLEKHRKKGNDLGVDENDAARRIRIIDGSDTRWGLQKLFAEEEASWNYDAFHDRGANGTEASAVEVEEEGEGAEPDVDVDVDAEGDEGEEIAEEAAEPSDDDNMALAN